MNFVIHSSQDIHNNVWTMERQVEKWMGVLSGRHVEDWFFMVPWCCYASGQMFFENILGEDVAFNIDPKQTPSCKMFRRIVG